VFNRSKKYILLLIINIIALVFVYNNMNDKTDEDPFSSEYVFALIEKEETLQNALKDLNKQLNASGEELFETQMQLQQARVLIDESEQKQQLCETEIKNLQSMLKPVVAKENLNKKEDASEASCEAEKDRLSNSQDTVASLQAKLAETETNHFKLKENFVRMEQLLIQIQNKENSDITELSEQVKVLQRALESPISLKQHYLSARYCNKPKFAQRICATEIMVRPSFTKPPVTRLGITIVDANDNVVIKNEFNSAQNQLYRLSLGRGKELESGNYRAIYTVDNQEIYSDWEKLVQE